jgi:hypothetical protein
MDVVEVDLRPSRRVEPRLKFPVFLAALTSSNSSSEFSSIWILREMRERERERSKGKKRKQSKSSRSVRRS